DLFPKKVATYDPTDPIDAHVLMPEYLTCEDRSEQVANHIIEWLYQPTKRAARAYQLAALKEQVGHGGASGQAADYILNALGACPPAPLRTHYSFDVRPQQPIREAA